MVKEGYKQTEVGVIPEDWEVKRLKHISPSQSVGLVINPSSYFDDEGSVPMLVGSHVEENHIDWETANRISNHSNNLLPSSRLAAGDLVTVRVGDPGVTAVIPPELDGCNCASMMIVRQHPSFVSSWLCYMMNSRLGRSQIEHVQYGTAQKQFNISDAVDFLYPVPPLPEQRSIAQALSDVDALIAALEKAIAKKRHLKIATMQQLLTGKKRLPGFGEGKSYQQTEVGVIPEDWRVTKIGEDALTYSGGTPSTSNSEYYSGDIPWITSGDLNRRRISEVNGKISEKGLKSSSAKMIPADTLLIALYGATAGVSAISEIEAAINQAVLAIIPKVLDKSYLFYILQLRKEQIIETYTQGGQPNLSGEIIRELAIAAPKTEEQSAIATVLSDMDAAIVALETRLAKTQALKQGMMQQLLTGRVRLV